MRDLGTLPQKNYESTHSTFKDAPNAYCGVKFMKYMSSKDREMHMVPQSLMSLLIS